MKAQGAMRVKGDVGLRVVRGHQGPEEWSMREVLKRGFPRLSNHPEVREWRLRNLVHLKRGLGEVLREGKGRMALGALYLRVFRESGEVLPYGLANVRVVTDAFVNLVVDQLQTSAGEIADFQYHGFGSGSTAEAAGDTALGTEFTTEYSTDNTRPSDSQGEGASANIYQTLGTFNPDASVGVEEHGVFDQASTGGGTLMDRSVFSVINLSSGDSLEATYELTLPSGS